MACLTATISPDFCPQILQRRQIIEDRKEMLETANTQREREEQEALEEQRRKAYEVEQERLNKEAEERDRQRQERERAEIQKQLNRERLEKLKTTVIGSKIVKVSAYIFVIILFCVIA